MTKTTKNTEALYHAISEIKAEYLDEADSYKPATVLHFKKWLATAACICICFCGTVPVLAAADIHFAYELLYAISPSTAQKLKPVHASCEDKGIRMEVVAANIEDSMATIYISMQDTQGDRLDETADLFDSYSIHTPYSQTGSCSFVGYDTETKTALFMITLEQLNDVLIPGDKITFSVSKLLSKKEYTHTAITEVDLSQIPFIESFVTNPDIRGWGGTNLTSLDKSRLLLIAPQNTTTIALEDGVTLTGYGIVDDKLHIQIQYDNILETDNHGDVYLKNVDGDILHCAYNIAFWDSTKTNSYEEYIFPVSAEELKKYELWGEFWTCNEGPIEGNWQVTIPLAENP